MTQTIDPFQVAPRALDPMLAFEQAIAAWGLEVSLVHLVKLRASQINGCGFCVHMHTREARKDGETEERLYLVGAWRESSLFTPREQAALAWTEALTMIAKGPPTEPEQAALAAEFTEEERVKLTLLVGAINTWNRLAVAFHMPHPVRGAA
ncbi:MAG: carboxymuconolactone decarboxylase family protein [Rhodospirillum sp.]|nr:carboxymuconolactone decarboxylase family protein [Rhodospirillum sp.]MCF8488653.1 carboxymuconolactone decarboxylase family protein [Rhodospirillum sp.]MCF8501742.1 carboxymuconolactone decarboxylase family protein [Rhodospirillum sp.]